MKSIEYYFMIFLCLFSCLPKEDSSTINNKQTLFSNNLKNIVDSLSYRLDPWQSSLFIKQHEKIKNKYCKETMIHFQRFFNLCVYRDDLLGVNYEKLRKQFNYSETDIETIKKQVQNNRPVSAYYEVSDPSTWNNAKTTGRLYKFSSKKKKHAYNNKEGKWKTLYVSDTTQKYDYFYLQRFVVDDSKGKEQSILFRNKVRILMGSKKSNCISGFYRMKALPFEAPYNIITEEDINRPSKP